MKPFKWIKDHPVEAAAIAAGLAITGGYAAGAIPMAAGAGAGAAEAGGAALLGADVGGAVAADTAAMATAGSAVPGSALLAPMGEDFAAQMAGQSMAGGGGSLLSPYAAASADPAMLGGNTPLGSPYSGWWDKFSSQVGDKFKDPKTMMHLGQMAMQAGAPKQQPQQQAYTPGPFQQAQQSQADITKKWLQANDPQTYRRIYGQGVA